MMLIARRGLFALAFHCAVLVSISSCGGSVIYGDGDAGGTGGTAGQSGAYGGSGGSGQSGGTGGVDGTVGSVTCQAKSGEAVKLAPASNIGSVGVGPNNAFFLAQTNVYASGGTVSRVPKIGGETTTVAQHIAGPGDLIVIGDTPYWTNIGLYDGGSAANGSLSSPSGPIDTTDNVPVALTYSGTNLYYLTESDVRSAPLSGHGATVIAKVGDAYGIAADASKLYLQHLDGSLSTIPVTGGEQAPFVGPTCQAGGMDALTVVADEEGVYWLDHCGGVWSVGKAGGTPLSIASDTAWTHAGVGHRIAVDSTRVYWLDAPSGSLMAADKHTGASTEIVPVGLEQGGIAVDDQSVYWSEGGAIWCARKPE